VVAQPGSARSARPSPARRAVGVAVLGVALIGLLSACSPTIDDMFAFGWPKGGITPQSEQMFNLWIGSTIAALAVGVFVWALIFWCVVRYRKRGEELPVQTRFNLPIELIYTVTPFLVIAVLFYYTAVVQTDVNRLTPNPDLVVGVEAHKWNWTFSYPNTKGVDGEPVHTVGTTQYVPILVVPTNKRIRFVEHSGDVVHSFWVPEMLFKRDVFPGNVVNQFETSILETGAYVGRCAELCGTYHSMMNFEVRAVTPENFEKFMASMASGQTIQQALTGIGEVDHAVTTSPFPTKRDAPTSA
jgi:cytochrome c oxidase subunit II